MAAIHNPLLTVETLPNGLARVTVRYTIMQFPPDYWMNRVYIEDIRLIGDDHPFNPAPPGGTDVTVAVFPPYTVRNPHAGMAPPVFSFERQRVLLVPQGALNEDPGFTMSGMPLQDEVFALITLTYADAGPWGPPFPGPWGPPSAWRMTVTAQTNTVTGRW
jgi:hypothetical protein